MIKSPCEKCPAKEFDYKKCEGKDIDCIDYYEYLRKTQPKKIIELELNRVLL